jgi:hypothetical protein
MGALLSHRLGVYYVSIGICTSLAYFLRERGVLAAEITEALESCKFLESFKKIYLLQVYIDFLKR